MPSFAKTVQATLSSNDLMNAFTAVNTPNGIAGFGVINAQPVSGDIIARFANAANRLLKDKQFIAKLW